MENKASTDQSILIGRYKRKEKKENGYEGMMRRKWEMEGS